MPDVDLEMIESARLALKQERAENARLHTENERLRAILQKALDWSEGRNDESWESEAFAALADHREDEE